MSHHELPRWFPLLSSGFLLLAACGSSGPANLLSPDPEPFLAQSVSRVVTVVPLDAVVTAVNDPAGVLDGAIRVDDVMVGVFEFDDSAEDLHKKADIGRYVYRDGPTRIRCDVGGRVFESDADAPGLTLRLLNDKRTNRVCDTFDADSKSNLDVFPGVGVSGIALTLSDDTATALSDDVLAGMTISMGDWTGGVIVITGVDGWRIDATLSAFTGGAIDDSGVGGTRKYHPRQND